MISHVSAIDHGDSRLVVMLPNLYSCRLVRQTPYACSPVIDDRVLMGVLRECIVAFGSFSAPRPILGGGRSLSTLLLPRS